MDEPLRYGGTVTSAISCRHGSPAQARKHQVNSRARSRGPIEGKRLARPPGAPHMGPAQPHLASCRSCCTRSAGAAGISSCSNDRANPRSAASVRSRPQEQELTGKWSSVRSGPPRSSTRPGCPAASPASSSPARSAARRCFLGGFPRAGNPSSAASRSSRCSATRPQCRRQLLPQAGDQRFQRLDPLRLRRDQRITRIRGRLQRRIGHRPQSSRKPCTATTATPRQPSKRNKRLPAATPSAGA